MSFGMRTRVGLACMGLLCAGSVQMLFAQAGVEGPHLWDKPLDPAIFEKRVNEQLDLAQKSIDQILAVKGPAHHRKHTCALRQCHGVLDTAGTSPA